MTEKQLHNSLFATRISKAQIDILVGQLEKEPALAEVLFQYVLQEDKEGLFDGVITVKSCLEAMTILLQEGLEFRYQRLNMAVSEDFSNATDVADYLARKGVPFREAYNLVGKAVKNSITAGKLLKDLTIEEWKKLHPWFAEDIYEAISPHQVVSARNSHGGTGFIQVKQAILKIRQQLATSP